MSSIRVSGNTSGYYDLTVPDVAGTNTIALDKVLTTDSNGNVGIGGTAYFPLHVYTQTDGVIARFRKDGGTNNPLVEIELSEANNAGYIVQSGSSVGDLGFKIGSSEKLTLKSNGDFAIKDGQLLAGTSTDYQQGSLGTHLFRSGSFETAINANSTAIKIFPAAGNTGRDVGDYHSGIGFNHLDPDYSTWGTAYSGTHAWIGAKVESKSAAELSSLVFATNSSTTANTYPTERMKIDPNGYVTTPNQPCFMSYKNGNFTETSGENRVPNWTEQFDTGGHMDASTGRFTAPVAGKYYFCFNAMHSGTISGDLQFRIYVNGAYYQGSNDTGDGSSWDQCTVVAIVNMSAGDYAEPWQYSSATSSSAVVYNGKYSGWMGYLIG